MATSWWGDGGISGYDPASGSQQNGKIVLATGGMVDAHAITRMQYAVQAGSYDSTGVMTGFGRIRVDRADYDYAKAQHANNEIVGVLLVAPRSAVAAISPTPTFGALVFAAFGAGFVFPSLNTSPAPPVGGFLNVTFNMLGPQPVQLQANTEYWVGVLPMILRPGQPATSAAALPSYSESQGRAVSIWTNRTPKAPTITSPVGSTIVSSGSEFTLAVNFNDDDEVSGGTEQKYTDVAGVHVQYAPRATAEVPNPPWTDLPFTDTVGNVINRGWWIQGSTASAVGGGAVVLAASGSVPIRAGTNTAPALRGLLPSGAWQIRVRTFDYGHAFPASENPLGASGASGSYTASSYPALNTSPWSNAVIVTVAAQVPAPIPMWPTENAAIPEDTSVVLTYQYRNAAVPPFAQAKRSIRIRKVGDATWHDLAVDQVSSSQSITVTGFALVSGNMYEWQVAVEDTDGEDSVWSQVARFWVVPAAGSGGVRPLPADTVEGATLGCGNNRVFVYRRGGKERVAELTGCSHVEWNRVRDDISTARIVVNSWDIDCGNLLASLDAWAYEIVIVRENGYSTDRVWEGPITLLTYKTDSVEIDAKDVMGYAYRRIIKQKMSDSANGDTVTSRAARVLQNVFAPDDPNLLAYLTVMARVDDAMQYRSIPAYSRTAFEEIDDMAANAGLDYTAVGRSILLWGTKHRIGTLPEFRDKDLGNAPIVSVYGMSMANVYSVSDGNGIHGEAYRGGVDPVAGTTDERYGLVEMLSSSWASDTAAEQGTYTQEGLNTVTASFEESAERSISDRYPVPVVVRVPDNTSLNPDTVISIQHLVPGVVIPLRSTATLRKVVANQKLDSVKVIQADGKETISVTMSPFSRDDSETGEGEGEG